MTSQPWGLWEDQFIKDHPSLNNYELSARFTNESGDIRRSPQACQKRRERLSHADRAKELSKTVESVGIPASKKPVWNTPITLKADNCLALFDVHLPYQDGPFIQKTVDLALSWGIENCILGGDLFSMDAYSKYGPDPNDILEHEFQDGEDFMVPISEAFKTVKYFLGNHEARMLGKQLERHLSTKRFVRLFTNASNVDASSYEWMIMETPDDGPNWIFAHPKSASMVAGRVPSMIASRRFSKFHVVSGHGHLTGMVRSEDGERWCIDSGMCASPVRIEYAQKSVGTRPVMQQGAVLIKNGYPYLVTPDSDWKSLEKLYAPEVKLSKSS